MGNVLKTSKNESIYPINGFDRYLITDGGDVYENIEFPNSIYYPTVEIVEKFYINGDYYVRIYNNDKTKCFELPVVKLLATVKYGDLPFNIIFKDKNHKNTNIDNIHYELPEVSYLENNNKIIFLDKMEFRQIPEPHSDGLYYITDDGAVYSTKNNIIMRRSPDGWGYLRVNLYFDNFDHFRKIHKLVYAAWINPNQDGLVIDHIDGKKYNNHLSNLRLVTNSINIRAAHDMGLSNSVWTKEDAHNACRAMQNGGSILQVADVLDFDVNNDEEKLQIKNFMLSLRNGRVFKDVTKYYNLYGNSDILRGNIKKSKQLFDEKDIKKICKLILKGKKDSEIHNMFPDISRDTIYNIRRGKQYYELAITIPGMSDYIEEKKKYLSNIKNATDKGKELESMNRSQFSTDIIDKIFEYLYQGYSAVKIEKLIPEISATTVNTTRRGITYWWYTKNNPDMRKYIEEYIGQKLSA